MTIKITPDSEGFLVYVNGWGTGATYKTYDGAARVAKAIADEAIRGDAVVIDYSECLARTHPTDEPLGRSGWTVSLELPDLAEPADFPDKDEIDPITAVEAFIAGATGSPDLWAYRATDNSTRRRFLVDMAAGPSVKELT